MESSSTIRTIKINSSDVLKIMRYVDLLVKLDLSDIKITRIMQRIDSDDVEITWVNIDG